MYVQYCNFYYAEQILFIYFSVYEHQGPGTFRTPIPPPLHVAWRDLFKEANPNNLIKVRAKGRTNLGFSNPNSFDRQSVIPSNVFIIAVLTCFKFSVFPCSTGCTVPKTNIFVMFKEHFNNKNFHYRAFIFYIASLHPGVLYVTLLLIFSPIPLLCYLQ